MLRLSLRVGLWWGGLVAMEWGWREQAVMDKACYGVDKACDGMK